MPTKRKNKLLKNDLEITPLFTGRQSISSKNVMGNRAGELNREDQRLE